jgi:hypothetical protein
MIEGITESLETIESMLYDLQLQVASLDAEQIFNIDDFSTEISGMLDAVERCKEQIGIGGLEGEEDPYELANGEFNFATEAEEGALEQDIFGHGGVTAKN